MSPTFSRTEMLAWLSAADEISDHHDPDEGDRWPPTLFEALQVARAKLEKACYTITAPDDVSA